MFTVQEPLSKLMAYGPRHLAGAQTPGNVPQIERYPATPVGALRLPFPQDSLS